MNYFCLIEDEQKVAAFIRRGLEEQGYKVKAADNGADGKKLLANEKVDLVIMDIMLPDINGVELCRSVREDDNNTPILMLTALNQVHDKVSGLKAGADDFLVKPFHFSELLARMEALMRRNKSAEENHQLTFDDLTLDTWSKTAERAGKKFTLTAKEY